MENRKHQILALLLIFLLMIGIVPIIGTQSDLALASSFGAELTGVIYGDEGVDADDDGFFDYLTVGVQVNVTESGIYWVRLHGLVSSNSSHMSIYEEKSMYLDVGFQVVNISLHGPTIYLSGLNPVNVSSITLLDEYGYWLGIVLSVPLSQEYSYTQFDPPGASLTGVIFDNGTDTDGDSFFDFLEVDVQVNVTESGIYNVDLSGLRDVNFSYIGVQGYKSEYLDVGLQVLNLSLDGSTICASGLNPRFVNSIWLRGEDYNIGSLSDIPLSREFQYTEFDVPLPLPTPGASLTGVITDRGVDSDGNGFFDYLEVGVQVNVTQADTYWVEVSGVQDNSFNYIEVWDSQSSYFNAGIHVLNVSLYGPTIYASGFNPSKISYISLRYENYTYLGSLYDVSLSREYLYTEFDTPAAMLTGRIYDWGVDTDGDGAFNYLEIGVEINVTKAGTYQVNVDGLGAYGDWISVYGYAEEYLEVGIQVLNISLYGPSIYASRSNPRYVNYISLYADYYSSLHDVPLSREYLYTEFDFPAILTGVISDRGVDTDGDGYFDYLEIGVQVNVSDSGTYVLYVSSLLDAKQYYIWVQDSKTANLSAGIQTVNLYLYGPQIYVTRRNPTMVNHISLSEKQDTYYYPYYDRLRDIPLSRKYSYTEFDAPFLDTEIKFVVYPDGRVAVQGALNYTNMVPEYRGPTTSGFFNLTGNGGSAQASTGLTLTLPPEIASQFPYNSTATNLLATYSNGMLNLGINSTVILPSTYAPIEPIFGLVLPRLAGSQYPFNATDGTITITYSGGILNLEIDGNTTLPPIVASQFPFNATDLTVVGNYAENTLDGRITFDILPEFLFDDVNVDFSGNKTDLSLNGTIMVVFGIPFGDRVIWDEEDLVQMLDELNSTIPGENGIFWNMTGGLLNVTNLYTNYTLNGFGANIAFKVDVHGNFIQALAYIMSGGRDYMLLYPTLNEAYSSAQSGAFFLECKRDSREAAMKLTFAYDLKRLMDHVLTPPSGTTPYVVTSYDMSPTLWTGDVVLVQEVNASDIVANPETGDIIAFYHPDYPDYTVIHRAINKTSVFDPEQGKNMTVFTTKADSPWAAPDPWSVPENLVIGKVVRRIPFLGYLLPYLWSYPYYYYGYPYPQSTVAPSLSLWKAAFSSVQNMSIQLSYSSINKQFDLKLTQVDKLKALIDEIAPILPETLPPELRGFVESFLNTTYASVSSAEVSLSYENGMVDFKATATIEGDLNAELNYVKNLYFQLVGAQYSRYNMTIPWQLDFLNQIQVDVSNLSISAKLDTTSFEGRIEGLTLIPPIDVMNATHFKLEKLFNFTAPQYSWQQEFPGQDQRLKITIEGGSNATHMVTLFSPTTVPEPDLTGLYEKSMVWSNQTLSSLKDLIFKIGSRITGTLTVTTTPVSGEVFINGEPWGIAPQSKDMTIGTYTVSFGDVAGYYAPSDQVVTVYENKETLVEGIYEEKPPANGTLTISTTPVAGDIYVDGEYKATGYWSEEVEVGTYTVSFGPVEDYSTPANQAVEVLEDRVTEVTGVYDPVPGVVVEEITEPELVNASNPFIVNATEEAATSLFIYEISDPITIVVKNITAPVGVDPPPSTWEVLGNYVQINVSNTDITVNATIRIYYTLEQLEASGLDESTLKIHYWNTTLGEWVAVESHVNTEEHFVWANINHFSLWALMGQSPALVWTQFLAIVGIAVAIIAIITVIIIIRKRKPLHPAPESAQTK